MSATVHDLLTRDIILADYDVTGSLQLGASTVRGIAFDGGRVDATLRGATLNVQQLQASGKAIAGRGSGTVALDETGTTRIRVRRDRGGRGALRSLTGLDAAGQIATKGRVEGPWSRLHFTGDGSIAHLEAFNVNALTVNGTYDATVPGGGGDGLAARVEGRATFLTIAGQAVSEVSGTVTVAAVPEGQRLDGKPSRSAGGSAATERSQALPCSTPSGRRWTSSS